MQLTDGQSRPKWRTPCITPIREFGGVLTKQHVRLRLATFLALLGLALMSASPIAAAPGDSGASNGNGNGNAGGLGNGQNGNGNAFGHDKNDMPSMSETPELSSLALFGTGAAGAAGYQLMRIRAGRRHDAGHKAAASEN
jgi:hypothetical protein